MSSESSITGIVHKGDGRGRELGFPTANLQLVSGQQRPANGVYACRAAIKGNQRKYQATLHVGPRPTFAATPSVEVHLLDFPDRDLYDQEITVSNLIFLRSVQKFASAQQLIAAITEDCKQARKILD